MTPSLGHGCRLFILCMFATRHAPRDSVTRSWLSPFVTLLCMLATSYALRDFVTQSWLSPLPCVFATRHAPRDFVARSWQSPHIQITNLVTLQASLQFQIGNLYMWLVANTQKGQPFRSTVLFWRRYFFVTYGV